MNADLVADAILNQQNAGSPKAFSAFAGRSFSLNDVARFEEVMASQGASRIQPSNNGFPIQSVDYDRVLFLNNGNLQAMLAPLDRISSSSQNIINNSELLAASPDASPGDLLMTMVSVQKFMFECQLTSSVANRTSDGIQELFRQQS
jgi:hypothetical protein